MAQTFKFLVTVEVNCVQGKPAERHEIEDALLDSLEANAPDPPSGLGDDCDTEYEINQFVVQACGVPKAKKVASSV